MGARRALVLVIALFVIAITGIWAVRSRPSLFGIRPTPTNTPTPFLTPTSTPQLPSKRAPRRTPQVIACPPRVDHLQPRITLTTYPDTPTLSDPEWPGFDVYIQVEQGYITQTTFTFQESRCTPKEEEKKPDPIARVLLLVYPLGEEKKPIVKEVLLDIPPPGGLETWEGGYHVVPENAGAYAVTVGVRLASGQTAETKTTVIVYEHVIQATATPATEVQEP